MTEPEVTNADRALWALSALKDFVSRTGVDDGEEAIGDLIANLLHVAGFADLDPARVMRRALACMEEEATEDQDGDIAAVRKALTEVISSAVVLARD